MNWGAVLFLCVLAPRVCRPAGKNGGVPIGNTPVFGRKPPISPSWLPIFRTRRGSARCAVRSNAQLLAHRVKEVPKRLANRGGWPIGAAGVSKRRGSKKYVRWRSRQMVGFGE